MTRSTTIDKKKFFSIKHQIKNLETRHIYNARQIAQTEGVSPETVRAINRTRTYPLWLAHKATKNKKDQTTKPTVAQVTKKVAKVVAKQTSFLDQPLTRRDLDGIHARIDALSHHISDIHMAQSKRTLRRVERLTNLRNFGE